MTTTTIKPRPAVGDTVRLTHTHRTGIPLRHEAEVLAVDVAPDGDGTLSLRLPGGAVTAMPADGDGTWEITVVRTTVNMLGRCPVARCRAARRVTVEARPVKDPWRRDYKEPEATIQLADGRIERARFAVATLPSGGALRGAILPYAIACVAHRAWFRWAQVEGTYNPDRECNARCMGATGPSCDCTCGGENHGLGHAV